MPDKAVDSAPATPPAPAEAQPPAAPTEPAAPQAPSEPSPVPVPEPEPVAETPAAVPTGLMSEDVPDDNDAAGEQVVTWTASEYVAHEKSAGWYTGLLLAVALIGGLVFLITRDVVSVGVVVVAGLVFAVYANHQPRQLQYRLDERGIGVGDKQYSYSEFRSFSVMPEGAFQSIVFMPLKRFSPPLTIYFSPDDETKIADLLVDKLPFEEMRRDAVDSLLRRIRF